MKRKVSNLLFSGFILASLFLCFGFRVAGAPTREWTVTSAKVEFKIKNAGFTVDGSFSDLNASISFDDGNLSASSIDASVSTKTINTGNRTRDWHLNGEKYFDVAKFRTISLKCNSFSKLPGGSYTGNFKLTIKGVTRNVALPFKFIEKDRNAQFIGTFTINRLDYGVGSSSMIMSDNVIILIEVNATQK